jgi:hypothetical protein
MMQCILWLVLVVFLMCASHAPICVQGILLVYDVTDRNSFQSIKTWVDEIDKCADKHVNKILIGNKCDVDDSMRVRQGMRVHVMFGWRGGWFEGCIVSSTPKCIPAGSHHGRRPGLGA